MADNRCHKCNEKLSIFYFGQECPKCGTNLLYYNLDERLKADAEKAGREVDAFNRFGSLIKNSSVASPVHIIRLVLFFTPLASMCLPVYYVNSEVISLISIITGIINGTVNLTQNTAYLLSVLTMLFVIILSLAEITASLFSAGKNGLKRNIIFSAINLTVFCSLGIAVNLSGGSFSAGWFATLAIYILCDILHFSVDKRIKS